MDIPGESWYYKIEVEPEVFTPGRPIGTLPIVRSILQNISLKGQRVLDIGAQEFVAPILIERQSPSEIVAYDRLSLTDQFEFLKNIYGMPTTTYVHGIPLLELRNELSKKNIDPVFDFVNFTGVLYHMLDPLAGMALARSFLRTGGIMFLETSVSTRDDYVAECNHNAQLYPGSNYFQISPKALDYWCRMLRMEVLDAVWYGSEGIRRIFMVLRACDGVVAERQDKWIRKSFLVEDFRPYGLDYDKLAQGDKADVPFEALSGYEPLVRVPAAPNYVDVDATVRARGQARRDAERAILRLSDKN